MGPYYFFSHKNKKYALLKLYSIARFWALLVSLFQVCWQRERKRYLGEREQMPVSLGRGFGRFGPSGQCQTNLEKVAT